MSSTNEIEILLKKGITLLHSSHANSATELRLLLDEEIKKRYGTEKTITSTMSKKLLEDEANFPGRAATPPPTEEVINLTHSPAKTISDSPDTIADSDDAVSGAGVTSCLIATTAEEETNLKEFGDLNCCICGEIRFTATNRLIECSKCGALYHQECHKPPISDEEVSEEQGDNWQCDNCISRPTTAAKLTPSCGTGLVVLTDEPVPLITASSNKSKSSATSSRSSSSSNSSSPFHKLEQVQVTNPVVTVKSSKTHREERTSSGNSKVSTINSLSSTTTKKHSSSSSGKSKSTSKHHDSKRKSNK